MKKVLWLSRHPMSDVQAADLAARLEVADVTVLHQNMTFSSDELEAVWQVYAAADTAQVDVIAGVFPAHVAMQLALHQQGAVNAAPFMTAFTLAVPVAQPVFAEDGQQRGFTHARWVLY